MPGPLHEATGRGAEQGHAARCWQGLPADLAEKIDQIWFTAQQELADESTKGSRKTAARSRHDIQDEQPAAVVEALEQVLQVTKA